MKRVTTLRSKRYAFKVHSRDTKTVKIKTENNGYGVFKTVFVVFLIVWQLASFLFLYFLFLAAYRWYLIISFALSLIACIHVLSTEKNGQSKAVWILFLIICFSFAYIIYILSDEHIFFARAKRRYNEIYSATENLRGEYVAPINANTAVKEDVEYLHNTGLFIPYTNTDIVYFPSGAQLFDDVLARLEKAEKFIFMEFFIIADGVLLTRLLDCLAKKAKEGVDIRIIYDDMGSHRTILNSTKERIKKDGIKIFAFNRLIPRFNVALNYRDHRKIIVVDGKTAYTGGSNIADEYINEKQMYGYWKDTGVRLDGTAVDGFTLIFLRQWEFLTKTKQDYLPFLKLNQPTTNTSVVMPYADGLDYASAIGKNTYLNIMASAKEKLYIMSPYFIPDDSIINMLANKALSGVDVRIILPGIPDKSLVYSVSRNNAERLIDSGAKIYCMKNSFVHSKLVLSENSVVIGSINIDLRSFYQQFESAVYTNDAKVLSDVLQDFDLTFEDCEQITNKNTKRRNIFNRIKAGILQLFAPLM
ncbi:MAG: cardiolipin synthase [Clostridia bacterium]